MSLFDEGFDMKRAAGAAGSRSSGRRAKIEAAIDGTLVGGPGS